MRFGPELVLMSAVFFAAGAAEDPPPAAERTAGTRTIGLVERAETRLAQIDVTVTGPPDVVRSLTAEDFRVRVHLKKLKEFKLDRICGPPDEDGFGERDQASPSTVRAGRYAPTATFLFYFDQPHLTLAGRQRALDVARELVERLISDGNKALIVSNAASLKLIEPLSSDPAVLTAALDRLEHDREQWAVYAEEERIRIDEVMRLLNNDDDVQRAIALARIYQREERWRTEQNLRRLEMALGQLFDLESPKAVVYFADTMRANAGEHYLSFFGNALRRSEPTLDAIDADSLTARNPFDRVVNEASSQGIRFYTIEARGLTSQFDITQLNPGASVKSGVVSSNSRVRMADAQRALADMAAETGGRSFLHGVSGARIASRVLEDSSCVYLISFDPSRYNEDVPYRVSVQVERKNVRLRTRGRIVFPSESSRLTSRLMRAFSSAGEIEDPLAVRVGLVPIDFESGEYVALLQISVPGTPLQGASWDLGATMLTGRKVRTESAGRIQVSGPGVPVILEQEIRFKPGAFEIIAVAHEAQTGLITSDERSFQWPSPGDEPLMLTPIAVVQPVPGAFLRNGQTRVRGSFAQTVGDAVRPERPTALIGLVCRSRRQEGQLQVERTLVGESEHQFPALEFNLEENRCAQVRDLIPANNLASGYYRYNVRVVENGATMHEASREFFVAPRRARR